MARADEAIGSLREAVRRDPSNHTLVLELADMLADARQFRDAETEYGRVLKVQPANGRPLVGLGMLLAATDRLEAALERLTRALEVNARDEEARLLRAEVLAGLDRTAQARAEFAELSRSAMRPDIREAARRALVKPVR